MLITLQALFTADELAEMTRTLDRGDIHFRDGAETAGWHARGVKHNLQATGSGLEPLLQQVKARLLANALFQAAAQPKTLVGMLLSRYGPGMAYGSHVDNALMGGTRTDLSFTLFLKEPESYDGGALILESNGEEIEIKLPAGGLVLYPSTSLHRVSEVKSGERLAVVGWVRSFIRRHDEREILFDLDTSIAELRWGEANRTVVDRLLKIRANLLRNWADD